MNAVDAVEQLTALGRRIQARAQQLQQPAAAWQISQLWEQMSADPLASLGVVLAAGSSAAHPSARVVKARISATPAASPFLAAMPPQPQAQHGNASDRLPPDLPVYASDRKADTHSPDTGVRLVRRQSSLLGILNANIDTNTPAEPPAAERKAHAPHEGVRATQPKDYATRSDAGESPQSVVHGQPGRGDTTDSAPGRTARLSLLPTRTPESVLLDAGGDGSVRSSRRPDAPAIAPPEVAPTAAVLPAARHQDTSLDAGMGMSDQGEETEFPAETRFLAPSNFMPHPPSAEMRADVADMARQGRGELNRWDRHALLPVDLPLDDVGWRSSPGGVEAERPLSLAQIDQVLAALDEKLEMLLLRMYGTAGGT